MSTTWEVARRSDTDTLLAFMREYYEFDRIPFDERMLRPALERLLEDESLGRVYLIREAEQPVGYVVLTYDYGLESGGKEVFVDELYVAERHRGRGAGTRTLEFVERVCRETGIRAIHLAVEVENTRAQGFYRKFGFGPPRRYLLTKSLACFEPTPPAACGGRSARRGRRAGRRTRPRARPHRGAG